MALAAVFAGALTLNAAWLANLLATRIPAVHEWFIFTKSVGAISGLLLTSTIIYLVSFLLVTLWYRKRDCSHQREAAYWFLIISIIIFSIMTIPGIFEFRIS